MSDPQKPTITVQIDGKDHVVARPDGLFSQAEIDKDYMKRSVVNDTYVLQTTMDRRFKEWTPKSSAAEDQEVIAAVIAKHKPKGKEGAEDFDLDSTKAKWKEAEYDPLEKKYNAAISLIKGSDIRGAAAEYFDEKFVTSPGPGQQSYMETLFGSQFEYDDELGYAVVMVNGQPVQALNPTKAKPYQDAKEFFAKAAENEAYKGFLKPAEKNNDSSFSGKTGPTGTDAKDPSKYKARSLMSDDEKLAAIKELGSDGFMKIPLNPIKTT